MSARLMLAAIDWNNSSRQQEEDEEGQPKMRMRYTKRGKVFVLRNVYRYEKTEWAADILQRVCCVHRDRIVLPDFARPVIPRNVAPVPMPDKADLQRRFKTRFTRSSQ